MKNILAFLILVIVYPALFAQDFDIKVFADTLKYKWDSPASRYEYREDLLFRTNLLKKYENEKLNIGFNITKSMLIPGMGHFQTKNYLRGQILLSTEIILAGTTYFLYDKSQEKYDKYHNSTQIDEMNQYYSDANSSYKQASLTAALFVVVWGYNLYDTYVVTKQYNDRLWLKNVDKETNKKIMLTPNGVSIKF